MIVAATLAAAIGLGDDEKPLAWSEVAQFGLSGRQRAVVYLFGAAPDGEAFAFMVHRGDGFCGSSKAYLVGDTGQELDHAEVAHCDVIGPVEKAMIRTYEAHIKRWNREYDLVLPLTVMSVSVDEGERVQKPEKPGDADQKSWLGPVFRLAGGPDVRGRGANGKLLLEASVSGSDGIVVPAPLGKSGQIAWIVVRKIDDANVRTSVFVTPSG